MADKVLVTSRFPSAMLARFAERYALMPTAGKPAGEAFSANQLEDVRAVLTAGGAPEAEPNVTTMPRRFTLLSVSSHVSLPLES